MIMGGRTHRDPGVSAATHREQSLLCLAHGTQIEEREYVSSDTDEEFPVCRKLRKELARFLENTGRAKQTWIPFPGSAPRKLKKK
jgi:hypothetical protein